MTVNSVDSSNNVPRHRSLIGLTAQGGIFGAAVGAALAALQRVDEQTFFNKGLAIYTERMEQLSNQIKNVEGDLAKATEDGAKATKTKELESLKNRLNFYKSKSVKKDASISENIINKMKSAATHSKNKTLKENYSEDVVKEITHIYKKAKTTRIFKEAVTLSIWCAGISLVGELIMRGFTSRKSKKAQ